MTKNDAILAAFQPGTEYDVQTLSEMHGISPYVLRHTLAQFEFDRKIESQQKGPRKFYRLPKPTTNWLAPPPGGMKPYKMPQAMLDQLERCKELREIKSFMPKIEGVEK